MRRGPAARPWKTLQKAANTVMAGDNVVVEAGTIDFGLAEGIIWTGFDTPYGPNTIGSLIGGAGALTTAGNNALVRKAANTYTGKTCVGCGILQVGDGALSDSRLGNGDIEVAAGAPLRFVYLVGSCSITVIQRRAA